MSDERTLSKADSIYLVCEHDDNDDVDVCDAYPTLEMAEAARESWQFIKTTGCGVPFFYEENAKVGANR